MGKGTCILLTAGIGLLAFTSAAQAQDEQWLQYHCQREADQIVGSIARITPETTPEKPQGVELPQFAARQQVFAQWATPMVESGQLPIALDQSPENGLWDRLYIDSNGNGHLSDEKPVKAYGMRQYYTLFGPVKVVFEGEDGPIVYHLNIRFYNNGQTRRLYISSACWYEGDITVEAAKKHCVLIDHNANGTFDDKALGSRDSDRIRIGGKNRRDAVCVGNYVDIDGVLYSPEIARDGAYIKLTKAENVEFGKILLPESITELSAGGENGLFTLKKPEKGVGSLPIGKYRIRDWVVERKDDQGRLWKLKGTGFTARSSFDINHAKQTQLSIGEPVISEVSARKSSGTFSFSQELRGRLDELIELTRKGAQPQAPKLHIKNKDGTYDRTYSFSYGGGGTCSLSWRKPKNVAGPFTATVDIAGPFKFESKALTISADGKILATASPARGGCGTGMPFETKALFETASVEVDSEPVSGEITASTTVGSKPSWKTLSLAMGLAAGAAGLAIYRRMSTI